MPTVRKYWNITSLGAIAISTVSTTDHWKCAYAKLVWSRKVNQKFIYLKKFYNRITNIPHYPDGYHWQTWLYWPFSVVHPLDRALAGRTINQTKITINMDNYQTQIKIESYINDSKRHSKMWLSFSYQTTVFLLKNKYKYNKIK